MMRLRRAWSFFFNLEDYLVATIADVNQKIADLKAAVDAHVVRDAAAVGSLQAQIDALVAAQAGVPSPADLQAIVDQLTAIQAQLP